MSLDNFTAGFARLAHRVGMMSSPPDKLFFAPEIRGAKIIATVSAAYLLISFFLGNFGDILRYVIWALCLAAAVMVVKNIPKAQWTSYLLPIVGVAIIVPLLLTALNFFVGLTGLLLVPLALLGLYGFIYKGGKVLDEPMRQLGAQLGEGWSAYAPGAALAATDSRVIKGPGKRLFYVSVVPGQVVNEYGDEFLTWGDMAVGNFDRALAAERRDSEQFKRVLWVIQPPHAQGSYDIQLKGGVTTYIGDVNSGAQELAGHLENWEGMLQNLYATQTDGSTIGREVERQAVEALSKVLPRDWQLRTNLILTAGGDADIELVSPHGRKFVVDIKARNDRPSLTHNDPMRPKQWTDIHEQLMLASRQLLAEPVVWQPRIRGAQGIFGEVRFVQGSAGDLLRFLAGSHGENVRGAKVERGVQRVIEDQEPLEELQFGGAGKARSNQPSAGGSLIVTEDEPLPNAPLETDQVKQEHLN